MKFREIHIRLTVLVILLGSLLWGFRELIFTQLPYVFRDTNEDMSFGWYVPLFSLYVLWKERRQVLESVGHAALGGFIFALPFLFIGFIGVRGIQVRFGVLAFSGLCLALPWALFGRKTAKRILFPALFLLFCLPLANFLDVITVHLRLLASSVAYIVLKGVGTDAIRQGTMIASASGSFAIDVAAPCSGLRSIFALMALTAGYAYFNQPTWLRRGLLFCLSVPLAVLGNVMRILTICLVASLASSDFATGFYHDYSGYVVFIVAILLMIACGELINRISACKAFACLRPSATPPSPIPDADRGKTALNVLVPILCLVVVLPVMFCQSQTPQPQVCELPDVHLSELSGFTSEIQPISDAERNILPGDTRIEKRLYTAKDGNWFLVSLVTSGKSKSSIHRPELCLPSQGFLMANPRTAEACGITWRVLTLAGGTDRPSLGFAYTFFNQDGFRTSSHVLRIFKDVWDRSLYNRIDRWIMVTVSSSRIDDAGLTAFLQRLKTGGDK